MGRVFKAYYTKPGVVDENGKPKRFFSKGFTIEYTDGAGRTIRRKGGLTESKAKDALKKAESDVLSEKNGLPTQSASDITCAELAKRYIAALSTRATPAYVTIVSRYLDEVFAECRMVTMKQMKPETVERYLGTLGEKRDIGSKAVNARLDALKSMLNWAVRKARLIPFNPLDPVEKYEELDSPHKRRALTEEEISRLLAAALSGPLRRSIRQRQNRPRKDGSFKQVTVPLEAQAELASEGRNNEIVYRLMIELGLRRGEVQSVQWSDVDLTTGILTTNPQWKGNKNGKQESLPIASGLISSLKARHNEVKPKPSDKIAKVTYRTLDHLNDDLVAAGIARRYPVDSKGEPVECDGEGRPLKTPADWVVEKCDAQGRTIDLHALRHTFGTRLGRTPGIDPKTVQTLMRHSDPRLTFGVYVHSDKERLKSAVESLPDLSPKSTRPLAAESTKRTGTDDFPAKEPPRDFNENLRRQGSIL